MIDGVVRMAKPVKKSITPRKSASPQLKRAIKSAFLFVILIGGVGALFFFARREVADQLAFSPDPPQVVLANRPAWMTDEVAESLVRSVRPAGGSSAFDQRVLQRAVATLEKSPWVRKVNAVRRTFHRAPGDTIELDCEFRAPLALVRWLDYYWLVDADGYKLPEQYTAEQASDLLVDAERRTRLRIIEGVEQSPVESGQRWPGSDLVAGLEMVRLLYGHRYADEIVKVDVSNFSGRVDPREAQLVLVTRHGTEIRWGRAAGAKDAFVEVPANKKLHSLEQVFGKYGRVDANQPWIDVRFDQITYPSAATAAEAPR